MPARRVFNSAVSKYEFVDVVPLTALVADAPCKIIRHFFPFRRNPFKSPVF